MPTAQQYEVEVKTLLGDDHEQAHAFVAKLKQHDPALKVIGQSNQLNHYFDSNGDSRRLPVAVGKFLGKEDLTALEKILGEAKSFALRSRQSDGKVLLVVKASKDEGGDHQHALERLEGEYETTAADIDTLDAAIQDAGYGFLSKWSRERREYRYKHMTVCIDKNAGYGFVAELEKLVGSRDAAGVARKEILAELETLGLEELSQERVGRMFDHYNKHWPEYYQTDKTFTIE